MKIVNRKETIKIYLSIYLLTIYELFIKSNGNTYIAKVKIKFENNLKLCKFLYVFVCFIFE